MSGIRPGSRLERLHQLAAKIRHEIEAETARERDASAGRLPAEVARVAPVKPTTREREPAPPGAAVVRAWAVGAGIPVAARGTMPAHVVDAYLEAHPLT